MRAPLPGCRWVGKKSKGGSVSTQAFLDETMIQLCDFKSVQEYAQYWCAAAAASSPSPPAAHSRPRPAPWPLPGSARPPCAPVPFAHLVRCGHRNMVPPPAACFSAQQKTVEALCIFKKGIKPMWEDTANESGGKALLLSCVPTAFVDKIRQCLSCGLLGEFQCRLSCDLHELDVLWEQLVRKTPSHPPPAPVVPPPPTPPPPPPPPPCVLVATNESLRCSAAA